jgi:hypothetical protein
MECYRHFLVEKVVVIVFQLISKLRNINERFRFI